MTTPVRVGELLPEVVTEAIARAGPGYERWAEQVAATGYCAHPVRLRGRVDHADPETGEVRTVYSTEREPDATLLKACGNRRASVCPSCSATYQADQFHLLAAGLRGGKGVPDTVSGHPRLFVTFTAPSFGRVHTRRAQGLLVYPCHPYRQGARCPHGRRVGCWQRHDHDDPKLGEPLCGRCYQAGAQVLWNAMAGRLWSRTTIYLYRALAQLAGVSEETLRRLGPGVLRQGRRIPEARGGPLPRHHPPGRGHRLWLPSVCGSTAGRVHRLPARGGHPPSRCHRGRALSASRPAPRPDPDRPLG
jgi:hypothetical protein